MLKFRSTLPWGHIPCRFVGYCREQAFNDQLMLIGLTLCTRPLPHSFPPPSTLRIIELGNIWRRFLGALISPRSSRFLWPSRGIPLPLIPTPLCRPLPAVMTRCSVICDWWPRHGQRLCKSQWPLPHSKCAELRNYGKLATLDTVGETTSFVIIVLLNENMCRP